MKPHMSNPTFHPTRGDIRLVEDENGSTYVAVQVTRWGNAGSEIHAINCLSLENQKQVGTVNWNGVQTPFFV